MKDYKDDSFPGLAIIFVLIVFLYIMLSSDGKKGQDASNTVNSASSQTQPAPSASK